MDAGTVTAEIAVGLPSLILVLAIALAALQAVATHVACVDSARLAARALARGDTVDIAESIARDSAPENARVETEVDSAHARVVVRAPVALGVTAESPFAVQGEATTPVEAQP